MAGAVSAFVYKDLTRLHQLGLSTREYFVAGAVDALRVRWFNATELASDGNNAPGQWVCLELSPATGAGVKLYQQEGLFQTLLQGIEPVQFWQLDPLLRCAHFQVYNRGILDWVAQHWQCAVTVKSIDLLEGEPDYGRAIAFALSTVAGLNYQPGLLELADVPQHYPLSALFNAVSSRGKIIRNKVSLYLDIVVGQTRVPLAELRGLQHNDLILLEPGEFSSAAATLCLQGRALFLADIEQGSLRVKQLLRSNLMADTDTPPAGASNGNGQDSGEQQETNPGEQRIDPGEIEVVLQFSLGTLTRSLAEIEAISEGYVFELSKEPADCVDINVNGKRLARGEPVMIEDRVGIRVVKIADG